MAKGSEIRIASDDEILALLKGLSPAGRLSAVVYLSTIGAVASSWSGFEIALDLSTLMLAGIKTEPGLCLTAQVIGPARKLDAYIAIARLRGADKFMKELDAFAKEAVILAERRNRVVHDPWFLVAVDSPYRLETTVRRKLRHLRVEMSKEEILKINQDIENLLTKFYKLHNRIRSAVGT
jgi:hypothetical protein